MLLIRHLIIFFIEPRSSKIKRRDVWCMRLSLRQILFVCFLTLSSVLHPSILFKCFFYTCLFFFYQCDCQCLYVSMYRSEIEGMYMTSCHYESFVCAHAHVSTSMCLCNCVCMLAFDMTLFQL